MRLGRTTVATVMALAVGPLALSAPAAWADSGHAPPAPTGLTVGDQPRPLNVEGAPTFGWLPRDRDTGEVQSAYRIRVSDGRETVWDSGKVTSARQSYVPYVGVGLTHGAAYTWTVRTWDRTGLASPWSRPASFGTGLADADWQASWIRRTTAESDDYTLARKDFTVGAEPVVRAVAYVAASQQYQLHVNGEVVDRGAAFNHPDQGYYRAVDVTHLLRAGRPATVGAIYHWYGSGQGRPRGEPGLLVRVVVDHADGSRQVIVTDGSWQVARGPWKTAPRRNGDGGDYVENIDGTAEPVGWDRPGYEAPSWSPAQVVGAHPAGVFTHLQAQESALSHQSVRPVKVTELASGGLVADFGKVIPAVPVVRFRHGAAGREVAMTGLPAHRRRFGVELQARQPGHRPVLRLHPAGRRPDLPGLHLRGIQVPAGGRPERRDQRGRAAHRGLRDGGSAHLRPGRRRRVRSHAAIGSVRLAGAVPRHPDPGEGPVPR
jgi:alpha-L-rhamnosidase